MWHQTVDNKRARVQLVNNKYRWQVFELWLDRHGKLTYEGKLLGAGSEPTLAKAKARALSSLG